MRKVLKWRGFVVAGFTALLCLTVAYVFFAPERELHREHEAVEGQIAPLPTDDDARNIEIAAGRRLAHIVGCKHHHRETLTGQATLIRRGVHFSTLPVHVLYPASRHLSTKVCVFVDWVAGVFERSECLRLLARS